MSTPESENTAWHWRKSSYSGQGGDCVEVADGAPGHIPVRDSQFPAGPCLIFPEGSWASFVQTIKTTGLSDG
ncbi:DUF397 domain-containing protein [Streptomyces sp. NPDC057654]|uniref:DUF397 domain-containing protein n=1 Tax=Streptomyces sp. NPDC057654 TaxID=3346196 RepID=UPI0036A0E05C